MSMDRVSSRAGMRPSSLSRGRRSKVRLLVQSGPADCGPACLRMVLGHFGRHVPARELSAEPVSERDGVTAAWLIDCAQRHGLHAEGFAVTVDQLGALPTPAILHTRASHFVVFEGWSQGRFVVVDPSARERWYLDENEAREMFSGTAIAFEPATGFERRGRYRLLWRAVSPLLAFDARTFAVVASVGICLTALTMVQATSWFWADGLGALHRLLPVLTVLERLVLLVSVLSLCTLPLLSLVDASVRSYVGARLTRFGASASAEVHHAAPQVPTASESYFAAIDPQMTTGFPESSRFVLTASALVASVSASWSSGGSVPILLAAFATSVATSVVAAHVASRSAEQRMRGRSAGSEHAVWCAHALAATVIWLAAFHLDGTMAGAQSRILFPRGFHAIAPQLLLALATFRLGGAVVSGARWLAIYEHLWEALPDRSARPAIAGSRIAPLLEPPPTPSTHGPLLLMTGVTFQFGDSRDRLLSDLTFELSDGERIAFVGPAAVGKTTLIRAILGSVRPSAGMIHYCGRSLHEYPQRERMRLVHGTTQGESLPDNTIRRIIRDFNSDLSSSRMRTICAQLGVDDEFSRLPLGYDTPVSLDGSTLSRGQRQMLVLARAAAAEARLLALDDPVNALDDAVARRVLEGLATLPSAVVITLASESAVSGLDYRIIHLGRVHRSGEEAPPRSDRSSRSVSTPMSFR